MTVFGTLSKNGKKSESWTKADAELVLNRTPQKRLYIIENEKHKAKLQNTN